MEEVKAKPKRVLSPEALAKLQTARKAALEAKRKNKTITDFKKEEKKTTREEEYQKVIEARKAKEAVAPPEELPEKPKRSHHSRGLQPTVLRQPEGTTKGQKPAPPPESDESSEEEEEIPEPIPRKAEKKKPSLPTEQQMYSKANIEMLRNRLYQQTRHRLKNDMFSY